MISSTEGNRALFMKGPVIGLPGYIPFRADREYTFCRLCGALYQPELERLPGIEYTLLKRQQSKEMQRRWSEEHNRTHHDWEKRLFAASGRFLSAEATFKLVPYGVIPLSDIVMDGESEHAGLEAPRMSKFDNYQWE
jgi:hypothetical protein